MPTVFDLLGLNEAGEGAGGLDFLRVFVPQDAERSRSASKRSDLGPIDLSSSASTQPDPMARLDVGEGFERATRPIEERLGGSHSPWLFLLGAPGAGKTALTRWLLFKLCAPGEGVRGMPDDLVPVRVEMRRFDEGHRRADGEHTFFDHLDREHGALSMGLRGESLRTLAGEGRIYWIFDGLDEVVEENRRRRYAEMIAGLADEHRACRGLVTSRLAGAEIARPLLERAGFATFTLQDFTEGQRDRQTARRLGLRRMDRFGMLLRVGGDVMGAVEVLPEGDA